MSTYDEMYQTGYNGQPKPDGWMQTSTAADIYYIGAHDAAHHMPPVTPKPSRGHSYRQGARIIRVEQKQVLYMQ